MLRIKEVEPVIGDLGSISENNIVDGVSDSNKVDIIKLWVNFWVKLSKFKLLVKTSFGPGFLISKARLIFAKLRQAFIKVPIFYYFNPNVIFCLKLIFWAILLMES